MDNKTSITDADARDRAYEQYVKNINDGWRSTLTPNPDDLSDADASPEADVRDDAYTSYVRRISGGWRNGE